MDKPNRILIIQLKRAGDVIVTTPVLQALKAALPEAQIDFLVDKAFAPILENNPHVDHVHRYDRQSVLKTWQSLRAARYDWILDFQSSPRSILAGLYSGAKIRAGYRVTFWGTFLNRTIRRPGADLSVTEGKMTLVRALLPDVPAAGERKLYLTETERQWAASQMGDQSKPAIGLIPTHRRASRRWPATSFVTLATLSAAQGWAVWLFWGPGEEDYVSAIQCQVPESKMIPKTSLRQMAALLERCKTVITNDNGPMHLAVAVNTPTVTVYGPTDPRSWNPGGPRHRAIQAAGLGCLGCNLNDCPFEHECMTHISPEQLLGEAKQLSLSAAGAAR